MCTMHTYINLHGGTAEGAHGKVTPWLRRPDMRWDTGGTRSWPPTSSRNHNALQANISKNYNDALISHETYASHVANSEQTLN